jgi:hypothetical protein
VNTAPTVTICIPEGCDYVTHAQVEKANVQVKPTRYPVPGNKYYVTVTMAYRRDYPAENTLAYAFTDTKEEADMIASSIKDLIHLRLKVR